MTPTRLAIVATHPIQHFVHFYRALAREPSIVLKLFFCSRIGVETYFDEEMKTQLSWNMDMLSGYDHEFLPEYATPPTSSAHVDNPSITDRLSAFQPDAVLTYGYATRTSLRTIAWCRFKRVPILMIGDTDDVARPFSLRNIMRRAILPVLLSQISAFLTVGDQNEAALRRMGVPRAKQFRTPYTIDEAAYGASGERRADMRARRRAQLGIAEQTFMALFVGKLSPRKRPDDLVEAARRLQKRPAMRPVHIVACGNGELFDAMRDQIDAERLPVTLAGFVNVDELPDYFAAADVLVHPSSTDPHPLVCSEAAIGGVPMVLSDRVGAIGPTDIAREEVNTLVYRCGDVGALTEILVTLAQDAPLCNAMGHASREVFAACNLDASLHGIKAALAAVRADGPGLVRA